MALIVQKYGGAVLSDVAKIRQVAEYIADLHVEGNQIVVVVSAMGYTTDDLVRLAYSVARNPAKREMDMLLTVGERITMSLMAMAIEDTGKAKAISLTGSQVGIITDTRHTDARIVEVRSERLKEALDSGKVVVIAGFQGVSLDREITTLGRGGSDTTAVAIAAALKADHCDLIKEVPGIFTSDPTVIPEAVQIPEIDYNSMKHLSLGGARILNKDCLEIAKRFGVELRVGTPKKCTKVKIRSTEPFTSVILKQGISYCKVANINSMVHISDAIEVLEINGLKVIFYPQEDFEDANLEVEALEVIKNLSKITAVGKDAEKLLILMEEDNAVEKIYYKSCFEGVAKVYFTSKNPPEILKRVHSELLK